MDDKNGFAVIILAAICFILSVVTLFMFNNMRLAAAGFSHAKETLLPENSRQKTRIQDLRNPVDRKGRELARAQSEGSGKEPASAKVVVARAKLASAVVNGRATGDIREGDGAVPAAKRCSQEKERDTNVRHSRYL